jgi:hypothetical protein
MANKPNNPSLWSQAKSLARQKFDVYPSAYANGWAAKWYKGKGGSWRKAEHGMEVPMMAEGGKPDWLLEAQLKAQGYNGNALQQKMSFMAQGGEPQNEGFQALPDYVQDKIMKAGFGGYIPEMMYGGYNYMQEGGEQDQVMQLVQMYAQMSQTDPQELIEQLQQMSPEEQQQAFEQMVQTVQQASQPQPDMMQAAMMYGGYTTGMFAEGGEPNGGMALGQMSAVSDKMNKLRQFVSPEQNLDPWIASKLAVMDDSADAISDYMMYNPEAQENGEQGLPMEQMMRGGGYVVTRSSDRKGKTHKVTGPDGTVKYFGDSNLGQHPKDPKRKAAFYARHKSNLAGNPFFRAFARKTWEEGGEIDMMKQGGSTFSGNAFYGNGGYVSEFNMGGSMPMFYKNMNKFANGGPAVNDELEVTPEQLKQLEAQGYQFVKI